MKEKEAKELIDAFFKAEKEGKLLYMDADQVDEALDWLEGNATFDDYCRLLEAGLRLHPNSISLLIRKCFKLIYDRSYQEAYDLAISLDAFNRYEILVAQINCLFCLKESEKALQLLDQCVANGREDLELIFVNVSDFLVLSEMVMDAQEVLKRGLSLFPDNLTLKEEFSEMVNSVCEMPQAIQAIQMCKDIINSHPYTGESWAMLGKLQVASAEYNEALESFNYAELCGCDIEEAEIKMLKAYCHHMNDNQAEAIKIYTELMDEPAWRNRVIPILAGCYMQNEQFQEGYNLLHQFINQSTEDPLPSVLLNLQTCCIALGRKQEADSVLEQAYELYHNNSIILHRMVILVIERNELDELDTLADQLYTAVEEDGAYVIRDAEGHDDAKNLFFHGLELFQGQDYEGALLFFRKAHELFPEMHMIEFFLAIACLKTNNIEGYFMHTHNVSPEEVETTLNNWFDEKGDIVTEDPIPMFSFQYPEDLMKGYLQDKNILN